MSCFCRGQGERKVRHVPTDVCAIVYGALSSGGTGPSGSWTMVEGGFRGTGAKTVFTGKHSRDRCIGSALAFYDVVVMEVSGIVLKGSHLIERASR